MADDPSAGGDAAPGEGVPGPLTVLFLAFIHLTALVLVFLVGASLVDGVPSLLLNLVVAALVGPLLALYAGLARWAPGERTAQAVGLVRVPGGPWRGVRVLAFAALLGAALAPLASEITARVVQLLPGAELDEPAREPLRMLGVGALLVVLVCEVVLVPLAEETLYRGFLQARVRMQGEALAGGWRAAFYVAGVHALVQIDPRETPGALFLALGFMLARRWGASTWAAVVASVASQALPAVLLLGYDVKLPASGNEALGGLHLSWPLVAACLGVAACAAYALWRLRLPEPGRRVSVVA